MTSRRKDPHRLHLLVLVAACLLWSTSDAHTHKATNAHTHEATKLQQQLASSFGARYIKAQALAKEGQTAAAIALIERLLQELGEGPQSTALRKRLFTLAFALRTKQRSARTVAANPSPRKNQPTTSKATKHLRLILQVELRRSVQEGKRKKVSRQIRRLMLSLSGSKAVNKRFAMAQGQTRLSLTLRSKPPQSFELAGTLQVGNKQRKLRQLITQPFEQGTQMRKLRLQIGESLVKLLLHISPSSQPLPKELKRDDPSESSLHKVTKRVKRIFKKRFAVRFRKASVHNILKLLSNSIGYKLDVQGKIDDKYKVTLNLKASTRLALLMKVCKQFGLRCITSNKTLRIQYSSTQPARKAPAAPQAPKAPKAPGAPAAPRAPHPPTPPTPPTPPSP